MKASEHELWQDAHAAARRVRDQHREPAKPFPALRVDAAPVPHSVRLDCPRCRGPVYAYSDSSGEALTCLTCETPIITRQSIGGLVEVVERTP